MTVSYPSFPPALYPQPSGTSVVSWRSVIGGAPYTFVALHVQGRGWFVTGRFTEPLSWDALCYLLPPEDGRFLVLGVASQITHAAVAR